MAARARPDIEPSTGARPLRRTIQRHIQDAVSEILIHQHGGEPIERIDVDLEDGELKFQSARPGDRRPSALSRSSGGTPPHGSLSGGPAAAAEDRRDEARPHASAAARRRTAPPLRRIPDSPASWRPAAPAAAALGGVPVVGSRWRSRMRRRRQPPASQPPSARSGRTIRDDRVPGPADALPEETLLYYLGLEAGPAARRGRSSTRTSSELWDRGLIDDIEVETDAHGRRRRPPGHHGQGAADPALDRLRGPEADLEDRHPGQARRPSASGVREGEPMSLGELQRVKTLIEELYAEKGYRFAAGPLHRRGRRPQREAGDLHRRRGRPGAHRRHRVRGQHGLQRHRACSWPMKKTKESGPITRILKKDIYDPATLQEDLDKVRDLYRGAGYKNVVIGEPQLEVRALNPNAANAKDQKRRMFLTIPIEEGERWKFGEVTIEGNEIYTDQALLRVFQHRPGGWLRSKVVDDGVKAITDLYHNTGYIFARVEPELVEKPGQVADVVVHVNEGDQFKVGRIEFEGNDRTMDKVLRRELRLYEGGLVNIGGDPQQRPQGQPARLLQAERGGPGRDRHRRGDTRRSTWSSRARRRTAPSCSSAAAGASSTASSASSRSTPRTSSAAASRSACRSRAGGYRDFFDLSYYIPWFLDRPQSIGLRAFDQDLDYRPARRRRSAQQSATAGAASLTYGRNFRLFQSASLSYNRSTLRGPGQLRRAAALPGDPPPGRTIRSRATSSRPVRHRQLVAAAGLRLSTAGTTRSSRRAASGCRLAAEYAGGFLGGDNYFLRPEIAFSLFQPISDYPARHGVRAQRRGRPDRAVRRPTVPAVAPGALLPGRREQHPRPPLPLDLPARRRTASRSATATRRRSWAATSFVQLNLEYHFLLGGPFRVLRLRRRRQRLRRGPVVRPVAPALHRGRRAAGARPGLRRAPALHLRREPGPAAAATASRISSSASAPASRPRRRETMSSITHRIPTAPSWASPWRRRWPRRFAARAAGAPAPAADEDRGDRHRAASCSPPRPARRPSADLKKLQEAKENELKAKQQEIKDLQTKIQRRPPVARPGQARRDGEAARGQGHRAAPPPGRRHPRAQQEARRGPRPRSTRR